MKYALARIGNNLEYLELPKDNRITYTQVMLHRPIGSSTIIINASEEEAIITARLLRDGVIGYDSNKERFTINSTTMDLVHPSTGKAICFVTWYAGNHEHVSFGSKDLFTNNHFEVIDQDCSRLYTHSNSILTAEIPF